MKELRVVKEFERYIDLFDEAGDADLGGLSSGETFVLLEIKRAPDKWMSGLNWRDDSEGDKACKLLTKDGIAWSWWMYVRDRSEPL